MKKFILPFLGVLVFLQPCPVRAGNAEPATSAPQPVASASPEPASSAAQPMKDRAEIQRKFTELSRKVAEQPELKALRAKIDEAQKTYVEAMEAAIAKEDAELVSKYKDIRSSMNAQARLGQNAPPGSGAASVTEGERQKLLDARKQAFYTDEVRKAREARKEAKTEEEKKKAEAAYTDALNKATVKADKDTQAILNKLEKKTPPVPNAAPAK